jgi:DNA-binding response OmpR family regulator
MCSNQLAFVSSSPAFVLSSGAADNWRLARISQPACAVPTSPSILNATTKYEFRLLYILAGSAGVIFNRQALLSRIWGSDTFVTTRSVDALVKRVRRKLRLAGHRGFIVTVRGVGYKLEDL